MPTLSLCLIVRDEEAMLPDLLESVAGLVDETVAVDTGSTDGTVALLEAAGARVLHQAWDDDFSAPRNLGLEAATGDWILVLDADERVSDRLREQIAALVADTSSGIGAATVVMRNELPGGHVRLAPLLRLFRSDPSVRFRHRIHEDVTESVAARLERDGLRATALDGEVLHLGYTREVAAERGKKERDLALIASALADDPGDLYLHFKRLEIARFWEDSVLLHEAAAEASVAAEVADAAWLATRRWGGELATSVVQGQHPDDPAAQLASLQEWSGRVRPSAALHYWRGSRHEELGDLAAAEADFLRCEALPDARNLQLATVRPAMGRCRVALARGDRAAAHGAVMDAVAHGPHDAEVGLAGCAIAREHLTAGDLAATRALSERLFESVPVAGVGVLVCDLCEGRDSDLMLELEQEEADDALRQWTVAVLRCPDLDIPEAFLGRAGAIVGLFPWLPDFVQSTLSGAASER